MRPTCVWGPVVSGLLDPSTTVCSWASGSNHKATLCIEIKSLYSSFITISLNHLYSDPARLYRITVPGNTEQGPGAYTPTCQKHTRCLNLLFILLYNYNYWVANFTTDRSDQQRAKFREQFTEVLPTNAKTELNWYDHMYIGMISVSFSFFKAARL